MFSSSPFQIELIAQLKLCELQNPNHPPRLPTYRTWFSRLQSWLHTNRPLKPSKAKATHRPTVSSGATQEKIMPSYLYLLLVFIAVLTGCGQGSSSPTPTPGALQSASGQPLPATLIDKIYQDPGVLPYRFKAFITEGWFKLEGNKYQQSASFFATAEGYPDQRWNWKEFGTCTPSGEKLLCESGYIQNYRFEVVQQGDKLIVQQDFTDPAFKTTYVYGK